MRAFPLFVRLEKRPVLLVGGGEMAAAKLRLLLSAHAAVTLVAPAVSDEIAAFVAAGRVNWIARSFVDSDLSGHNLVFSAIEDDALDMRVSVAARDAGILVNVVDRPELSDLIMPAIVDRDEIVVAISTNGGSPVLAQRVRAAVEAAIPHGVGRLVHFARRFRGAVHARISDHNSRRRFWAGFFDGPIAAALLAGHERQAAREVIRAINSKAVMAPKAGVFSERLIDATNVDLLTLGDLRALQQADLVLFDAGIAPAIVDMARRDARRQVWDASSENELAAALAGGARVVRLKALANNVVPALAANAR
ncbi:NAD(P)-dependent oxidoreductase [Dongia sp.]|jgi:uroporphyrin-III C-methyltransferase/precorrin-2 dehydrogenase/sirohydrochlorin ferrochelatase|uniref:precorrin-2 dehydrogenase/sirohydrochlorin ferrochelatase family protein n=1 Tax=Dongia sp. TaxID=1977262 RepID=UPI0034A1F0B0